MYRFFWNIFGTKQLILYFCKENIINFTIFMITEGINYTSKLIIANSDTAISLGSGDLPVLATPRMMALMENAAMLCVAPYLPEGSTTVGGHIASSHVKPSKVGAEVSATATLTKVEGKKLYFDVKAEMNGEIIGEGTHLRFIVDKEKFLARL